MVTTAYTIPAGHRPTFSEEVRQAVVKFSKWKAMGVIISAELILNPGKTTRSAS